ncbi:hypothetical protein H8E07_10735 [bacterium]|nr:hypothetical protein [bacterium]
MTSSTRSFPGKFGPSLILTALWVCTWTSVVAAGVEARVHAGEDLTAYLEEADGTLWLRYPGLGDVELYLGPDDPRFPRGDVTEFRPLPADVVARALGDLGLTAIDAEVDVFLLPAPPVLTGSSFARRDAIFLAPSFGHLDDSAVASVTVHELGHVLTWLYFDPRPEFWDAYMSLRGLDPQRNGPRANHADRAREILAEDIRYLFGGAEANLYGSIENARLDLPDAVSGLSELLTGTMRGRPGSGATPACSAFPNPCNPRTTVELRMVTDGTQRDPAAATLEIFDMRGRHVRTVAGGLLSNDRLLLTWDGRDEAGDAASSGRYLYVAGWHDLRGRGAVTLVK